MKYEKGRRTREAWACAALCASSVSLVLPTVCAARASTFQSAIAQAISAEIFADPAVLIISTRLTQRLSGLSKIDEVSPSGMPILYGVRVGTDLFYSNAQGNHLIRGELIKSRGQPKPTSDFVEQLTAIEFDKLPLQEAIVGKSGSSKRRTAAFADSGCPYRKRVESGDPAKAATCSTPVGPNARVWQNALNSGYASHPD